MRDQPPARRVGFFDVLPAIVDDVVAHDFLMFSSYALACVACTRRQRKH